MQHRNSLAFSSKAQVEHFYTPPETLKMVIKVSISFKYNDSPTTYLLDILILL